MIARMDIAPTAAELACAVHQLGALGLLSEGGRGTQPATALTVVRDAVAQTESGALAGYGASDTRYALEIWRLALRLFESDRPPFRELSNTELAAFLDKIRTAAFGPQVSSALARWLPSRIFISPQYTAQYLDKLRPSPAPAPTADRRA